MRKTQMVATLAFVFMLGVGIPIGALTASHNVSATENLATEGIYTPTATEETAGEATPLAETAMAATFAEFRAAINDPQISKITLTNDIDATGSSKIQRSVEALPLEIDLNGHKIDRAADKGYALSLRQGQVSITGSGQIIGRNGIDITGSANSGDTDYATLTIGKDVEVVARVVYGIAINSVTVENPVSYGIKLNLAGKISAPHGIAVEGRIQNTENIPQITIADGAEIAASGVDQATAVYAAGNANWQIGAAQISGDLGVGVRAGMMTFNNTTVTATGEMQDNPGTSTGGINSTGVVFQIEHHASYVDNVVLNINDGTYTSANGDVFYEYGEVASAQTEARAARAAVKLADINITGGTFTAGAGRAVFGGELEDDNIEILGGKFSGADVDTPEFLGFLGAGVTLRPDGTVAVISSGSGSNHKPNSPEDDVEASEDPSAPGDVQNPIPGQDVAPGTGTRFSRGITGAASTLIPLVICAGSVICVAVSRGVYAKRKAFLAQAEIEIDEQLAEMVDEPEPTIDHFVAEPIARVEPKVTPVDTFILQ